jgi:hypothetical protein
MAMYLIITRDEWFGVSIIENAFGKSKLFEDRSEAVRYIKEMQLTESQIVKVTI